MGGQWTRVQEKSWSSWFHPPQITQIPLGIRGPRSPLQEDSRPCDGIVSSGGLRWPRRARLGASVRLHQREGDRDAAHRDRAASPDRYVGRRAVRVDFAPLAGSRVFLDAEHVTIVDKDWVISSIRRTMAEHGVLLENNKDKAQVIVEAAFGAYGTDQRDRKTGLPGVGVTPSLTGPAVVSNGSSTSLTFSETNQQDAVVKAAMFAYEVKTGQLVWESGPIMNAQGLRDHFVLGSGPYRLSSRPEVEQYPERVAEPSPQALTSTIARALTDRTLRRLPTHAQGRCRPGMNPGSSGLIRPRTGVRSKAGSPGPSIAEIAYHPRAVTSDRPLAPGHRHGRRRAVAVAADVLGPVLEPGDEAHELLDRFFVGLASLLGGGQLRLAQHAGLGVAAGPRDDRRRAGGKQIDPVERAVFLVEADHRRS